MVPVTIRVISMLIRKKVWQKSPISGISDSGIKILIILVDADRLSRRQRKPLRKTRTDELHQAGCEIEDLMCSADPLNAFHAFKLSAI